MTILHYDLPTVSHISRLLYKHNNMKNVQQKKRQNSFDPLSM